jgi:hypothetical protein
MSGNVGRVKKEALNSAGGTCQTLQLFRQRSQTVSNLKDVFDREHDSRKLKEVVTNCLRNIKTRVRKDTPETHHIRRLSSGKVHEFHK